MTSTPIGDTPADVAAQLDALLDALTLEEKAALSIGRDTWTTQPVERLGIPSVWLSDGPTGLRKAYTGADMSVGHTIPATCFPTESALGSSWDVDLVHEIARAIAIEAQAAGVQVLLGPGLNIKRSPLCGRNFEYFSEDPILTGQLAAAYVRGLQKQGVGGCLKHLVANESETDRMISDSQVDERTMRELYLHPFEIAVATAAPWTMMAAYNRLNGVYCAENRHLLHDIVVGEWGYHGIIMSDWYAVNDRAAGIEAGLHLQMPFARTADAVVAAVREGRLPERRLDAIVRGILAFVFKADAARRPETVADLEAHHILARRAAGECLVLLKNEGALLPLEGDALVEVALIGAFGKEPRYQGAGSSQVVPAQPVETIYGELGRLISSAGQLTYAAGYSADGNSDAALLEEAQAAARRARVAVVVVGLPSSYEEEGVDRKHLDLPPGHNALVDAVLQVQPRTVVVLLNGTSVALPWAAHAPAILEGWLGGQATGGAIADALLGRVNPSGKLAETFPVRLEDTPAYLCFPDDGTGRVPFAEGLYTGYRWYDARRIRPLFPFGHGLSYTSFAYRDLTVDGGTIGDNLSIKVSLRVRNVGSRAGREVVQLYVSEQQPRLPRPAKELKAFAKVALDAGQETLVAFELGARDFAAYDPSLARWVILGRSFRVLLGASSQDIRLEAPITLDANYGVMPPLNQLSPLRAWLRNPAVGREVRSAINILLREQFPEEAELASERHESDDQLKGFVADMPIVKLVMFGALSAQALTQLIARANADMTGQSSEI
jgi:beta-glucosidase